MGIASVFGLTRGIEAVLWLVIAVVCAVVVVRRAAAKPFLHGFLIGLIGGSLAPLVQALLFSTYAASNPEVAEASLRQPLPDGMTLRMLFLIMTPLVALMSGVALGGLTWAVERITRKKPPHAAVGHR